MHKHHQYDAPKPFWWWQNKVLLFVFSVLVCDYLRVFIEEDVRNFDFVTGVVNGCRDAPDFQHAILHQAWRETGGGACSDLIRPPVTQQTLHFPTDCGTAEP